MVLFSAAWTWGMATPARADAAAILPVFLMNSRREVRESWVWFIGDIFLTLPERCQFKKSSPRAISETPDRPDSEAEGSRVGRTRTEPRPSFERESKRSRSLPCRLLVFFPGGSQTVKSARTNSGSAVAFADCLKLQRRVSTIGEVTE